MNFRCTSERRFTESGVSASRPIRKVLDSKCVFLFSCSSNRITVIELDSKSLHRARFIELTFLELTSSSPLSLCFDVSFSERLFFTVYHLIRR